MASASSQRCNCMNTRRWTWQGVQYDSRTAGKCRFLGRRLRSMSSPEEETQYWKMKLLYLCHTICIAVSLYWGTSDSYPHTTTCAQVLPTQNISLHRDVCVPQITYIHLEPRSATCLTEKVLYAYDVQTYKKRVRLLAYTDHKYPQSMQQRMPTHTSGQHQCLRGSIQQESAQSLWQWLLYTLLVASAMLQWPHQRE